MKKGLTILIEKVKAIYMWAIQFYVIYLLAAVAMTPVVAFRLLLDEGWFYEFRYDVFKRRMNKE